MAEKSTEDLAELRARLSEAKSAVAGVPEDADDKVKAAAKAHHESAERALREAHVEAVKREVKADVETRPADVKQHEVRKQLSLQESNQSASTQNVRGTENLTPVEHSARRNPKHT
jgi:ribosomal protein S11